MGRKNFSPVRFRIHRTYSLKEVVATAGVHINTVRNWLKEGLQPIDDKRPIYIKGNELKRFLAETRRRDKSPCRLDELFCIPCRAPRRPAGDLADLLKLESRAKLTGICPVCQRIMHKWVALKSIPALTASLDICVMDLPPALTSPSAHNGKFIPLSEL